MKMEKETFEIDGETFVVLKSLSINDILDAQNDLNCEEFFTELGKFTVHIYDIGYTTGMNKSWSSGMCMSKLIGDNPKRKAFALEHGFIKLVEKETYSIGDRFEIGRAKVQYILGSKAQNEIGFTALDDGTRWGRGGRVQNTKRITRHEMIDLIGEGVSWERTHKRKD
jgi:hypothetical protein